MTAQETARRALGLLDLTTLGDNDTTETVEKLCAKAVTPHGHVAAICVWPRFVETARRALGDAPVKVAAVANFPHGALNIGGALADVDDILDAGGDEVDLVFPYNSWFQGKEAQAFELVKVVREHCGDKAGVKVIMETGCLRSEREITRVSEALLDLDLAFLKTSTGKVSVNATIPAARAMMNAIKASGKATGFKAAGGIRTAVEAAEFMGLADKIMGADWISPTTFRFGASSLLNDLLAVIEGRDNAAAGSGY